MTIKGFAVELDGELQIATAAATEQAAQVNGLVCLFNVLVHQCWKPDQINEVWHDCILRAGPGYIIAVVPIVIDREKCN